MKSLHQIDFQKHIQYKHSCKTNESRETPYRSFEELLTSITRSVLCALWLVGAPPLSIIPIAQVNDDIEATTVCDDGTHALRGTDALNLGTCRSHPAAQGTRLPKGRWALGLERGFPALVLSKFWDAKFDREISQAPFAMDFLNATVHNIQNLKHQLPEITNSGTV